MKYEIGKRIRYYRELKRLSQKDFAKAIGVSNSRVSNWELGINRPDADLLYLICHKLGISADELLGIELNADEYSEEEKRLVANYRAKPELQTAVKILLGIETE